VDGFAHAQAVDAGAVVVGEGFGGDEAEAVVEAAGGAVGGADFEAEGAGAEANELPKDAVGEAGTEASSAEIGVDGEGVESAGAGAGSVAVQEADGPAGEGSADAGEGDAGVGIGEEGADLAAGEAFAGMAVAAVFHVQQRLAVPARGGAEGAAARGIHPREGGGGTGGVWVQADGWAGARPRRRAARTGSTR
jgi:hypothetical protein